MKYKKCMHCQEGKAADSMVRIEGKGCVCAHMRKSVCLLNAGITRRYHHIQVLIFLFMYFIYDALTSSMPACQKASDSTIDYGCWELNSELCKRTQCS